MPEVAFRQIVVVGLMGSGKTTIGGRLAPLLGRPFHDSDEGIEARTGRSAKELKDELGEDAMHALEADDLLSALDGEPAVIAAAASTIESEACRQALGASDVAVVWLRGLPAVLAARFASGSHRPSFGTDPQTFIADQARRREPLFESLASIVVDIDRRTADEVLAAVVTQLGIA
jgi:shikimate kinase